MNKTIIININGIIFHIEEDAYEVLQNYMTAVKRHFGYSTDSNEIVGDIENRIAEMFSERISPQKAVIVMADVNEVIAQMGDISDFEDFDESADGDPMGNPGAGYQESIYSENRGLFRDPDDKIIGGVCSGLGYYFDLEAKWIRLALILLVLFAGSGLLVYIILWILIPMARSRADKMSMRGEAANLHNFKRNFDEEMGDLKRNFTAAGKNISPSLKKTARKTGDALDNIIRITVKIIGIFVIIISVLMLISCVIALAAFLGGTDSMYFGGNFIPVQFIDSQYYTPFIWVSFLTIAIPLIALILISVRMVSGTRTSKYLGYSLLIVWIGSIGFLAYYGYAISIDHAVESIVEERSALSPQQVYQLSHRDARNVITNSPVDSLTQSNATRRIIISTEDSFLEIRPRIYINKVAPGDAVMLIKKFSAEGRNYDIATNRAQRIQYNVTQDSNRVTFDSHAFIGKGDLIRDQEVRVDLNIPVGTRLLIDKDMIRRIYLSDRGRLDNIFYIQDSELPLQSGWVMTPNGLNYVGDSISLPPDTVLKK